MWWYTRLAKPRFILVQSLMRGGLMHTGWSWWCCMIPGWLIRANQIGSLTLPSGSETLCTWQKRHATLGENWAPEVALTFWVICSLMGEMLLHSVDIHVTSCGGSFAVMDTHGTPPYQAKSSKFVHMWHTGVQCLNSENASVGERPNWPGGQPLGAGSHCHGCCCIHCKRGMNLRSLLDQGYDQRSGISWCGTSRRWHVASWPSYGHESLDQRPETGDLANNANILPTHSWVRRGRGHASR